MPANLRRLFDTATPRSPEETSEAYAANLSQALRNEVDTPIGARSFLKGTYATQAMRSVCDQVMDRLCNGRASNRQGVYAFESGFGGGKTHTAIVLAAMTMHPDVMRSLPPEDCPADPAYATDRARVIAINGQDADAHGHIHIKNDQYAPSIADAVRAHLTSGQSTRTAAGNPGVAGFSMLIGDRPMLILIDELVQLLNKLDTDERQAERDAVAVTLSDLAAAVTECPRAVMIITTPEPGADALQHATQQVNRILRDTGSLMARITQPVTPSDPADVPHILRRRLFESWDDAERGIVADAYADVVNQAGSSAKLELRKRFHDSYPFHPDLMDIINNRLSDNPNFQQVRGTLRLLSATIDLQQTNNTRDAILHPYHVDPRESRIREQFVNRLERRELAAGINADIDGDRNQGIEGAHEAAVTIMLGSVAQSANRGLTEQEVVDSLISPRQPDRGLAESAIKHVADTALYVSQEPGRGLWFSNEPSLRKMAEDRQLALRNDHDWLKRRVDEAVLDTFSPKHGAPFKVLLWPSKGRNLPDEPDQVHLGILNPEHLHEQHQDLKAELIALFHKSPASGGNASRSHRNNALFLVASRQGTSDLEEAIVNREAYERLSKEPNLKDHQRDEARERAALAQKAIHHSVQRNWCNLYYPASKSQRWIGSHLQNLTISQADQEGKGAQTIVNALIGVGKLVNPGLPHLNPVEWRRRASLRSNLGPSLKDLHAEFTDSPSMLMFLSKQDFAKAVAYGVKQGDLGAVSATGQRFDQDHPLDAALIRDDFRFYLPGNMPAEKVEQVGLVDDDPVRPEPTPDANQVFREQGPMPVVRKNLEAFLDQHGKSMAEVRAVTMRHTDHGVLTGIAGVWQGTNDSVTLSWSCYSDDGTVSIQLTGQTPDWWQEHRRDIDRAHHLAGQPGATDAEAVIRPHGNSRQLESTFQQLSRHDIELTATL